MHYTTPYLARRLHSVGAAYTVRSAWLYATLAALGAMCALCALRGQHAQANVALCALVARYHS